MAECGKLSAKKTMRPMVKGDTKELSQYKADLKNLLALSEQIRGAGDRLASAVSEIPSIAKALQDMGCYDSLFARLMDLQRAGEKQHLEIRRMSAGLKEIVDIYARCERHALTQAENGDIQIAVALPGPQRVRSKRTPASLYRDEWNGNAGIRWWDPQISKEQRARMQPAWIGSTSLLPLRNMFTAHNKP